jgi:hypothetical protein
MRPFSFHPFRIGKWFEFNDSMTKEIDEEEVRSRDAYCLLYQRRGTTEGLPPLSALIAQAAAAAKDDAEAEASSPARDTKAGSTSTSKRIDDEDFFDPVPTVRKHSDSDDDDRKRRGGAALDIWY